MHMGFVSVLLSNPPNRKTVPAVDLLTPLWERILRRSPIGPNENFFDLGGTAPLANRMIREARTTFHRDLPLETLAHAPTIAALADAIERPGPPPSSPVVLLKNGNDQPPIFVVHGLDGSLVKLIPLVRRIVTPRPIYGIQARGFWGEPPLDRIEDMAAFYLEAIRRVQPHGPYTFVGYSFGGLVSHEMTRLLSAQKKKSR